MMNEKTEKNRPIIGRMEACLWKRNNMAKEEIGNITTILKTVWGWYFYTDINGIKKMHKRSHKTWYLKAVWIKGEPKI